MIIGEIGGPQEAEAALYAKEHMTKPVIGYVAGLTAPKRWLPQVSRASSDTKGPV